MQQVVEFAPHSKGDRPNQEPPLAFLDTDVVLGYLRGEPATVQLFGAESEGRIRLAINPIVLQELILTAGTIRLQIQQLELQTHGIRAADALHASSAIEFDADLLVSTDDALL
jgi:hypothetical protein